MKISVFGRTLEVVKENGQWAIYTLGEGKKSLYSGIVIPAHYGRDEVVAFLGDIFHEAATPENPDVVVVEE
jgi:hypothetical protein